LGYLIGTDEAGYGPNLGPLLVTATLWSAPGAPADCDLYRLLAPLVVPGPREQSGSDPNRARQRSAESVCWADSKSVYSPRQGLGLLEHGVLAALAAMKQSPRDWRELWRCVAPESAAEIDSSPWFADYQAGVPVAADATHLARDGRALNAAFDACGARLLAVRSRAVFPAEFNQLVQRHGNKATVLSCVTLDLAAEMLARLDEGPILLLCDKHGGRNRYGALLQQRFPDDLVETRGESRLESVYRFGPARRRIEARFQCRGESALPVALASMFSKYLRELSMRAFNEYWLSRVPGLLPTAGYPVDAQRFRRAIEPARASLGFADELLWRSC
jgi:hypothetical protein